MTDETNKKSNNNPLKRKFIARQPIFNRQKEVVAYELLFRAGIENSFDGYADGDNASSRTLLDSFLLFGMKELTGGKRLFINFTRNLLLSDMVTAFPREMLVIELLESIKPEPEILTACKHLKECGYQMALDDFVFQEEFLPLMDFMDIVKVDFQDTAEKERKQIFKKVNSQHIQFLAEKVETMEEFSQASEMGYDLFQGYFFSKPTMVSTKDIPSVKVNMLRLLNRIYQKDVNFLEIEDIIKKDVSLAYKLIRFINSAAFGLHLEVHSIRHVLNLLGINELRKWMSLVVLSQLSHDKPEELMTNSIIRARFCELIADNIQLKKRGPELFLMGLFSLIDAFFERPMEEILDELPLSIDVKLALIDQSGIFGHVLRLVENYEKGAWDDIFNIASQLKLPEEVIPEMFFESIVWANALNIHN